MSKVSCIIPAYNESSRIINVLSIVSGHPLIDELIVVNDGSTDDTSSVVSKFPGVKLVEQEKNSGKSMAVYRGLKESSGDIVFLLDADLVGLTRDNVSSLLLPVISDKADISFSVRRVSFLADLFYRFVGMDILTGERAFKKGLVEEKLEELRKLSRFGIETFFNRIIVESKSRIKVVFWNNVRSPLKSKKRGFFSGILADLRMVGDILKTASVAEIIGQLFKLRNQRV